MENTVALPDSTRDQWFYQLRINYFDGPNQRMMYINRRLYHDSLHKPN